MTIFGVKKRKIHWLVYNHKKTIFFGVKKKNSLLNNHKNTTFLCKKKKILSK
jgi:hypothetical protein